MQSIRGNADAGSCKQKNKLYTHAEKKKQLQTFLVILKTFIIIIIRAHPEQDCVTSYDSSSSIVPVWRAVLQALRNHVGFP
jgi:hypothetical protein